MNYKETLNLPKTDFPMKANLPAREPSVLEQWERRGLFRLKGKKGKDGPLYVLHDGPPYANGHIHIGHALNKILKDMIVKSKRMEGKDAPFVPGWDCHGLPIEFQVLKSIGSEKKKKTNLEIRKLCRDYAEKFVKTQKEEFKRLGVFGDWESPYLTMMPGYEASIVREFGKIVAQGSIYKGKKPVLWCTKDETALAEAEVEYSNHTSPSIYVKFPIQSTGSPLNDVTGADRFILVWTTTPWTLPANQAVAVHPRENYVVSEVQIAGRTEYWILAESLLAPCMETFRLSKFRVAEGPLSGEALVLKYQGYQHPFFKGSQRRILTADFVTMDQGTGCVHIAPGHGQEDYELSVHEDELEVFAPVDDHGRFTAQAGISEITGMEVFKANDRLIQILKEKNVLIQKEDIEHSYPHCWRCKNPVIFRATEQWFISMEKGDLRHRALAEIDRVRWIPRWGRERIYGMIENRPDWCISRQRVWGVPVVAFVCLDCRAPVLSESIINHVADQMEAGGGSDIWFSKSAADLLPEGTLCPECQSGRFEKEKDILDVWFESGVSHAAVLKKRGDLRWPADLYLEGSDQHRGWFHSALLTAMETDGTSPYQSVLTHGFVVDGSGKKMSKSFGNVVVPQEVIQKNGAEILRLWVASTDFREDVRISKDILDQLIETYRKIRNTCRFLLGNLYDFDPGKDRVSPAFLWEMDRWAMNRLQSLIQRVRQGYDEFEFHIIIHTLNYFCAVEMSSFYLDIIKDRLYVSRAGSIERRAAQQVLYDILMALTHLMAPILSFTAEEIWSYLKGENREFSIFDGQFPDVQAECQDKTLEQRWDRLLLVREDVARILERARKDKKIGHSLEAAVYLYADGELLNFLQSFQDELATLLIVSRAEVYSSGPLAQSNGSKKESAAADVGKASFPNRVSGESIKELGIAVVRAPGKKCERCWMYLESVGVDPSHSTLCERCVSVLTNG